MTMVHLDGSWFSGFCVSGQMVMMVLRWEGLRFSVEYLIFMIILFRNAYYSVLKTIPVFEGLCNCTEGLMFEMVLY
jgi:hypothetical protein